MFLMELVGERQMKGFKNWLRLQAEAAPHSLQLKYELRRTIFVIFFSQKLYEEVIIKSANTTTIFAQESAVLYLFQRKTKKFPEKYF